MLLKKNLHTEERVKINEHLSISQLRPIHCTRPKIVSFVSIA